MHVVAQDARPPRYSSRRWPRVLAWVGLGLGLGFGLGWVRHDAPRVLADIGDARAAEALADGGEAPVLQVQLLQGDQCAIVDGTSPLIRLLYRSRYRRRQGRSTSIVPVMRLSCRRRSCSSVMSSISYGSGSSSRLPYACRSERSLSVPTAWAASPTAGCRAAAGSVAAHVGDERRRDGARETVVAQVEHLHRVEDPERRLPAARQRPRQVAAESSTFSTSSPISLDVPLGLLWLRRAR